ncbi:flagellar biosynthesis anti-sigma factor FlgM [Erythrobacter sp. NE805]|uniref:flagellar biosynthesis anti-sigma factor FlgM n=1 Tax=Erythrobacter sp. NE805 TaxID=3389875 RepID=UPI00396AF428
MPSVELSKLSGVGGLRAVTAGDRAQIEARPAAAGGSTAPAAAAAGISLEVTAASAAATPPVDAERVAEIRKALSNGSYPLVPTRIADAMIAAQVRLSLPERS